MGFADAVPTLEATTPEDEAFREFVAAHRVSSETSRHFDVCDHRRLETALDLSLFAERPFADGGAEENLRTWMRLRDLALRVLPRGTNCAIRPFDAAYHMRPEARWRPEVELVIEIRPADEGLGLEVVDDRTRRTATEILRALDGFGVARGTWRDTMRRKP